MKKRILLFSWLLGLLTLGSAQAQYSTPGTSQRYTLTQLAAMSGGYVTQTPGG